MPLSSESSPSDKNSNTRSEAAAAVCMEVNACASCDSGEVNRRTYRVKAMMTPKPMTSYETSSAPATHTAT